MSDYKTQAALDLHTKMQNNIDAKDFTSELGKFNPQDMQAFFDLVLEKSSLPADYFNAIKNVEVAGKNASNSYLDTALRNEQFDLTDYNLANSKISGFHRFVPKDLFDQLTEENKASLVGRGCIIIDGAISGELQELIKDGGTTLYDNTNVANIHGKTISADHLKILATTTDKAVVDAIVDFIESQERKDYTHKDTLIKQDASTKATEDFRTAVKALEESYNAYNQATNKLERLLEPSTSLAGGGENPLKPTTQAIAL